MAKTPEVTPKDEMHLDDFLNAVESTGRREVAAAFALHAKAKGWVKREAVVWEKDFEAFLKMTP